MPAEIGQRKRWRGAMRGASKKRKRWRGVKHGASTMQTLARSEARCEHDAKINARGEHNTSSPVQQRRRSECAAHAPYTATVTLPVTDTITSTFSTAKS
eukprot:355568-Chlamydomonas_euryale.AAC.3